MAQQGQMTVTIDGVTPAGSALPVAIGAPVSATAPTSANILAGSVLDDSAIITIPANRIWFGYVALSASLAGASAASTASVNTTGVTASPASTVDLCAIRLSTGTTDMGVTGESRSGYIYVYGGASGTTLDVSIDGSAVVSGMAYGYLLN